MSATGQRRRRPPPDRVIRRNAVPLGAAVVVVLTGVLADAETPWSLERTVGQWIYDWPDGLETVFELIQQTGTLLAIVLVAAGLVVTGRYRAAGAAALAGFDAWLASSGLKEIVERPRPRLASLGRVPREVADGFSWPSSHAAIAAALATVLLMTIARGRVGRGLVIAVAVLVAVGRVYLGAHWGLDVIGGAALGVLAGYVAVLALKPT